MDAYTVQPDRRLLFPYICEVTAPDGSVVALEARTTGPLNARAEILSPSEVLEIARRFGLPLPLPSDCKGGSVRRPAGRRLTLNSDRSLSVEYGRTVPLRELPAGARLPLIYENVTDRYTPQAWADGILLSQPSFPIKADSKALGQSFCWLERLEVAVIYEVEP